MFPRHSRMEQEVCIQYACFFVLFCKLFGWLYIIPFISFLLKILCRYRRRVFYHCKHYTHRIWYDVVKKLRVTIPFRFWGQNESFIRIVDHTSSVKISIHFIFFDLYVHLIQSETKSKSMFLKY